MVLFSRWQQNSSKDTKHQFKNIFIVIVGSFQLVNLSRCSCTCSGVIRSEVLPFSWAWVNQVKTVSTGDKGDPLLLRQLDLAAPQQFNETPNSEQNSLGWDDLNQWDQIKQGCKCLMFVLIKLKFMWKAAPFCHYHSLSHHVLFYLYRNSKPQVKPNLWNDLIESNFKALHQLRTII